MHPVCTLKDSFSKDFKDSLSQNKLNFEGLKKKFREWDHGWVFFEGSKQNRREVIIFMEFEAHHKVELFYCIDEFHIKIRRQRMRAQMVFFKLHVGTTFMKGKL